MPARTIALVDAIKEVFEADAGPLQESLIARRVQARHPDKFVLENAYFRNKLSTLAAGGYLEKIGPGRYKKA